MTQRQPSPDEQRLLRRQQTAELQRCYAEALVNGSQFKTADGSIRTITVRRVVPSRRQRK
jgi:hypothetical protein